jgi:hypothetical protein
VINDGEWHTVAANYDGTTTRIFIDGTFVNSADMSYATAGTGVYIGKCQHSYPNYLTGKIRNIAIGFDPLFPNWRALPDNRDYTVATATNVIAGTHFGNFDLCRMKCQQTVGCRTVTYLGRNYATASRIGECWGRNYIPLDTSDTDVGGTTTNAQGVHSAYLADDYVDPSAMVGSTYTFLYTYALLYIRIPDTYALVHTLIHALL